MLALNEKNPEKKCEIYTKGLARLPADHEVSYQLTADYCNDLVSGKLKPREEALPIVRKLCTKLLNQNIDTKFHNWALRWVFMYEDDEHLSDWYRYVGRLWTLPDMLALRYRHFGDRNRYNFQQQACLFLKVNDCCCSFLGQWFGSEEETAQHNIESLEFALRFIDTLRNPSNDEDIWIERRAFCFQKIAECKFRLGDKEGGYEALEKSVGLYETILSYPPDHDFFGTAPYFDLISGCRMNWFDPNEEKSELNQESTYINIMDALEGNSHSEWTWFEPYREEVRFRKLFNRILRYSTAPEAWKRMKNVE
ncbi:MAG: hypothetical protein IJC71_01420 [Clostridia bacterium]|nr:hypothetical protein [Clostridia bacterium]